MDLFFICDVGVNFATGYIDAEKQVVRDPRRIASHYFKGWFAVDFIACIPLELFVSVGKGQNLLGGDGGGVGETSELQLVSAFKCVRLFRLGRFVKMLQRYKFANIWGILRLYMFVILLSHWLGCGWYVLTWESEVDSDLTVTTWLEAAGLAGQGMGSQYLSVLLAALLMLFRTIATPPQTDGEILYMTFVVLLGACVHATIFGQVAHLVASMNSGDARHTQQMQKMHEQMRYHHLPRVLQERVSLYYDSLWDRQREHGSGEASSLTKGMSEPLALEVSLYLNRDMVEKVPMFKDVEKNVILSVISSLRAHMFLPGDYIVRAGEMGDRMYFIRKGRCVVLIPVGPDEPDPPANARLVDGSGARYRAVKTLKDGDYFGEISLLFRMQRTATICSTTFTDASSLGAAECVPRATAAPVCFCCCCRSASTDALRTLRAAAGSSTSWTRTPTSRRRSSTASRSTPTAMRPPAWTRMRRRRTGRPQARTPRPPWPRA